MLNIAIKAARRAGNIINRGSRNLDTLAVREKAANDFVSEVDREAEQAIIRTLLEAYPKHSILAEESGATNTQANRNTSGSSIRSTAPPISCTAFRNTRCRLRCRTAGVVTQAVIYDPVQ